MLLMIATVLPVAETTNNETGYSNPVNSSSDYGWTTFLQNTERTGFSKSRAPQKNTTQWEFKASFLSSPVIDDNKVFVESENGLYCLDIETGKIIWHFYDDMLGGFGSPTIYDGKIFVVSTGDYIYCFDVDNGHLCWCYEKGYGGSNPSLVVDNKLYVSYNRGDNNATLLCLDPTTGSKLWDYDFGYQQVSYPMVAYNRVYIGTQDSYLHCLNATSGRLLWSISQKSDFLWSPTTFDERLYTSWRTKVFCLNPYNGSEIWKFESTDYIVSSIALAYGKAYFTTARSEKGIYCLDAYNGSLIWSYNVTPTLFGVGTPVVADGKLYVSTHGDILGIIESELLCLNATAGELIWKRMMGMGGGCATITPAIGYGKLFASNGYASVLYCFGDYSNPPTDPSICGRAKGLYGTEYEFIVMSEDPDGDDIRYKVDWGDGNVSEWSEYTQSGAYMKFSHVWNDVGVYTVRVIAEDEYHVQSHWSKHIIEIIDAPMLEIKTIRGGLFKVNAVIRNSGTKDAVNVNWSIKVDDGLILLGKETTGTSNIPVNDKIMIVSKPIVGFGSAIITVHAVISNGFSDIREQKAFVFLFFISLKFGS